MPPRPLLALAATALLAATAAADPRTDFLLQCAGCHLPGAAGLPPEVPSLHDVPGRMVATPAGRIYLASVPGAAQAALSDAELAAVLNWILAEYNATTLPANFKPLSASEVGKSRRNVLSDPRRYRRQHWPELDGY
jgi:mono/diheme cytochrome c family protein